MRFKKGSKVEVLANTEGPCVEFRCAQIIFGNGRTYSVQYGCSSVTNEASVGRVQRKALRPSPPLIEGVKNWEAFDLVEVYDAGSWKIATVLRFIGGDFYLVRCMSSCKQLKVHKTSMRVRQSWIDGQWVIRHPVLGNSGVGNSSCNFISSSYKVMPEIQQAGTGICRQDRSDCFPGFDASGLYDPFLSSSARLKRASSYGYCSFEANTRKLRSVMDNGEYERFKVVSAAPFLEKVDAIAYPQNNMGENCMHAPVSNGTNEYYETWKENPCNVTAYFFERIKEPGYSCNDLSSVGSCGVIGSTTNKSFSDTLAGPCQDDDTLCSDAESIIVGEVDKGCPISHKEVVSERIHRLELHTYRSTLESMYSSGPLSWEQEELLTNLRISLDISNDEHLMEIKNLVSAGQKF